MKIGIMNEFKKYQHVERFGTVETNGIDIGTCYVFPKIDGANSSLWWTIHEGIGQLHAGSRNRELTLDYDNSGFFNWCIKEKGEVLAKFFRANPSLRLYGEWLVPHTLKTYEINAWNNFYVFDVMEGDDYIPYESYQPLLEGFNIDYIPPICKVDNPTYERLVNQLEKNGYLIEDGKGTGEGVVIKNYNYENRFGRVTWAKIVRNDFKTKHQKCDVSEIKESRIIEQEIANKYITLALVEKEHAKIDADVGWASKLIPRLLNTIFYCLVKEETWNFIKENKNPVIDFKRLMHFSFIKIKELKPELF